MQNLNINNHYVPQVYLKKWSLDNLKIWAYPILVSHKKVPLWNLHSIRGIAYHKHLYTRISFGDETDEFECWLNKEFETPAEEALEKATSNRNLKAEDWHKLIRFAAAQFVRTPANLSMTQEKWKKELPKLLNNTLQKIVHTLEESSKTGKLPNQKKIDHDAVYPIRVSREPLPDTDKSLLRVDTFIGRSMWLSGIKHLLTNTVNVLLQHKWSILHAAPGFEWVTSDDPVICLNYYGNNSYDFSGGWGNRGSEIIFPLSPNHILYTKVGDKRPFRKDLTFDFCVLLQQMFIEHAHRYIFAKEPIKGIENSRPRIVDEVTYKQEVELWNNWHHEQSTAEKEYE